MFTRPGIQKGKVGHPELAPFGSVPMTNLSRSGDRSRDLLPAA